jgi:serine/threonine protein kinase
MSLGPGSRLGPFKIQSLLGKGGMGEVFSALDTRLDRKVALKILPADFARDADRLRRFQSEAKALASLNHPNVSQTMASVLDVLPSGKVLMDARSSRENLKELSMRGGPSQNRSLTLGTSTDRQPTYSTSFEIPVTAIKVTGAILGRHRWTPDGKSLVYLGQDERGINGLFLQDFAPDRDTGATRRKIGEPFDSENSVESFGISPDGQSITVAIWEQFYSIMITEGLN